MLFTETPTEPKPPSANAPPPPPPPPRRQTPPPPPPPPRRVLAGRHGEWDTHELIKLLDTIEDERARGRFREALYVSVFFWLAIAWFVFYGPRFLWHAPELRDPASVLRERELTELRMPTVPRLPTPTVKPAHPVIDNKTMAHLRETAPQPAPAPAPAAPQPAAATPPPPPPVTTNAARVPPPVVADAPTAQPNAGRTPFATNSLPQNPGVGHRESNTTFSNVGGGRPGPQKFGGVDIISDTQGVDFDPYLRRLLGDIKRNWEPLLPPEAGSPLFKQGETYIRFTILPDGSIKSASMHLDGSTHDVAIDKSCWNAITSEGQYPPLPKNFHGPEFELRIHFLTNKQPAE